MVSTIGAVATLRVACPTMLEVLQLLGLEMTIFRKWDHHDAAGEPPGSYAVIGIGGRGCSAVEYLLRRGFPAHALVCVNTDSQYLARLGRVRVSHGILLGDGGTGSGGRADHGRSCAEAAADDLSVAIRGAVRILIVAGLGGGAGSGAAPVVARLARAMHAEVHALVTLPFTWEGEERSRTAASALQILREHAHFVETQVNDDLLALPGNPSSEECFAHADARVLAAAIDLVRAV